jgi:hypothetical protein
MGLVCNQLVIEIFIYFKNSLAKLSQVKEPKLNKVLKTRQTCKC